MDIQSLSIEFQLNAKNGFDLDCKITKSSTKLLDRKLKQVGAHIEALGNSVPMTPMNSCENFPPLQSRLLHCDGLMRRHRKPFSKG